MRSVAFALLFVFLAVTSFAAVPRLIMPSDDGEDAVVLANLGVHVTIRGHLARTEYTLAFRNRLPRVVGGDFVFPVPPGGEVSDLALVFDGKPRHAVAVERVQAKRAYEETVHRRVDPALAEWTDSRAFRMRLYPIPPFGEKWVSITCDQELVDNDYVLDLRFKQRMDFTLFVDSDGLPVHAEGLALRDGRETGGLHMLVDGTVRIARPENDVALTAWSEREHVWYVSEPLRVTGAERPFEPAAHVTLLWDASGSAVQQDRARLRAFLDEFLRRQRAWATVTVIPFHLKVDEARRAVAHDLPLLLDDIDLAGATNLTAALQQLPAIAAHVPESRLLLVTDGINSMGDTQHLDATVRALASIHRPLTVVNAAPRADETLLRSLAETTGGRYLDLTTTSPEDAAERAMLRPARMELPPSYVPRVVTTAGAQRVLVAARMTMVPNVAHRKIDALDLIRRAWARARLRELKAPEEIAEHGKRYTMLTPRTSLLVLESWRDYEMYGIELPPDVAEAKARELAEASAPRAPRSPERPAVQFQGTAGWWVRGTVVMIEGEVLPGVTVTLFADNVETSVAVTDANGRFWLPARSEPMQFRIRAELSGFTAVDRHFDSAPSGGDVELVMRGASVSESITVTAASPAFHDDGVETTTITRASVIGPADMALSAEIARAGHDLEHAPIEQRHEIVLRLVERIAALRSTSARMREYAMARVIAGGERQLHLGVAEAMRAGDEDLALRVLTDLAEAYADDAPLVRIVARIADGWGHADVAHDLLLHALDVSPMEPQTWRELLRMTRGSEAKALNARLNAMAKSAHLRLPPEAPDGADLQVEVMWECDFCDVDLHVVEPDGEEVMYSHRTSKHGGQLTDDITDGFGPEIYAIRSAPRGTYKIVVEYFGSDRSEVSEETLVHVIVTRRGHRRDHTLLLSTTKERVEVTAVEIGGGS